ncbi:MULTISPECIES: NADH-quinone oxidoreductase subunit B [Aestuariimicrobium]|uniref:NADH-quinone oxidoreductase subunit B n=1 Tax=Aestuariimicrobium TaxID=396388 RepID=UPI001FE04CC2|nr:MULTISPECIES: proton-conducting membrane transporter [Aestuariimicrobium]
MTSAVQTPVIDWFGDGRVAVVDLSLACCAVESEFAVPVGAPRLDRIPEGAQVVAVVSGTLTDPVARLVADRVEVLPESRRVVAFGACACAGGPYWDSYSVTKGVDQLVAVDHYIPGCPPAPSALAEYVSSLVGGVA